jgi:hypothetical protein
MSVLTAALAYAERHWRVFPCGANKLPIINDWPNRASCNPLKIERWWRRHPRALIGCPTGPVNGFVALDVDCKRPEADGRDTLSGLGFAVLPVTRIAHTRSGGFHLHFQCPDGGLCNTVGAKGRGIGPGCDWRANGGFVVLPSPDSGYEWDGHCGIETPLATVPPELLPRNPAPTVAAPRPVKPAAGLSPYAEAALDSACRRIIGAPNGQQHDTLRDECISIGALAGGGAIPSAFARDALLWAASRMPSHDPRRPWRQREIERQVDESFDYGLARPRGDKRA